MDRRKFFVSAAATALAPFALAASGKAGELHQDGADWFTNVEVKTQDGRTLRFYDDVLKGKIVLINFFYHRLRCDLPADDREPGPRSGAAWPSRRQGHLHGLDLAAAGA